MSNRPTPETDDQPTINAINDDGYAVPCVDIEYARKLERERDEALEAIRALAEHGESEIQRITKERDEARVKMADALQDVDLRTLDFERMKQERDEAIRQRDETNESSVFSCNFYYEEKLKAERERDEAREKAERYRLDANALMLQRDEAREELRAMARKALEGWQ